MFCNLDKHFQSVLPDSECYLCRTTVKQTLYGSRLLCHFCHTRLPKLNAGCSVCAMPLASSDLAQVCGSCLKHTPAYSKTVSAFLYEPPINDFITQLKFNAQRHFVTLMSEYLFQAVKGSYLQQALPQVIIPVPLHSRKTRQRGFNQAQLIARYLAQQLKIPLFDKQVMRTRYTQAQSTLTAVERQKNLRNAFRIKSPLNYSIAIVDDVITTGTTANVLSQALLKAGAKQVDVWCLARAFLQ